MGRMAQSKCYTPPPSELPMRYPFSGRRIAVTLLASLLSLGALAQGGARARPPGTVPLDEPPPLPASSTAEAALETQVTTRTEGDQTIQEYRVNGKVYMQRVTPKHGRPYVLMDHRGDGTFTKQDNSLDQGVRVPQWTLLEF